MKDIKNVLKVANKKADKKEDEDKKPTKRSAAQFIKSIGKAKSSKEDKEK